MHHLFIFQFTLQRPDSYFISFHIFRCWPLHSPSQRLNSPWTLKMRMSASLVKKLSCITRLMIQNMSTVQAKSWLKHGTDEYKNRPRVITRSALPTWIIFHNQFFGLRLLYVVPPKVLLFTQLPTLRTCQSYHHGYSVWYPRIRNGHFRSVPATQKVWCHREQWMTVESPAAEVTLPILCSSRAVRKVDTETTTRATNIVMKRQRKALREQTSILLARIGPVLHCYIVEVIVRVHPTRLWCSRQSFKHLKVNIGWQHYLEARCDQCVYTVHGISVVWSY